MCYRHVKGKCQLVLFCYVLLIASGAAGTAVAGSNQTRKTRVSAEMRRFNPAECFDKVWQIIHEEFWDPNFNGVGWEDAGKRYRPRALAAKDHEAFAVTVNQMLGELKTSHTRYLTAWDQSYYGLQAVFDSAVLADVSAGKTSTLEQYLLGLRSSQNKPSRSGIGLLTKKIGERHYVTAVFISSPAEKAGFLLGDWVVEVNRRPFHPIRSFKNAAGQELEILTQRRLSVSSRQRLKVTPLVMTEREMYEDDSRASTKTVKHRNHSFVYIRLWWLNGLAMRRTLASGIDASQNTEGVIIDLRDGFGGGPATSYIHPFLKGGLETITIETLERERTIRSNMGFNKPVIVLINGGTRSGKELLAYYFKKTGQALLLGERTAGYVTGGKKKRISSESILYYSTCMLVIDGKRLEGAGIEPDVKVPFDIRFAAGKDIQLERAKDEMVRLIETPR